MANKNRFDVSVVEFEPGRKRPERAPGPMRKAVRENAESVQASSEAKIQERRKNATDAKELRSAKDEGRILARLPIGSISTDDLPRDRIDLESVASSDEMMELKASIKDRGQRDPIEVYLDANEGYQLKSGWRRLEALRQLQDEEGGDRHAFVLARVDSKTEGRITLFKDMAEENLIRDDLSFAEMARLAITVADDPAVSETEPRKVVGVLYDSLNKTKRSYIRSFVDLLLALGVNLKWPKNVARNTGVDVARLMAARPETVAELNSALSACGTKSDQDKILKRYLAFDGKLEKPPTDNTDMQQITVTFEDISARTRGSECKLVWNHGFGGVSEEQLQKALKAFRTALDG